MHVAVPFRQKITLILFGIILTVVLLEAGLRAAGFTLQSLQEYRNLISIKRGGEYRIMCIGESTTAGEYPPFLEKALNERNIGIKFSVIDKGIVATNTSLILAQLEENIGKFRPDLVVAMIGINEGGIHMPIGFNSRSQAFFGSLKVCKLIKLLLLHMQNKIKEVKAKRKGNKVSIPQVKNEQMLQSFVASEQDSLRVVQPGNITDKGNEDDSFFNERGKQLTAQGDLPSAREAFKRAVELNPNNLDAYFRLVALSGPDASGLLIRKLFETYISFIKAGTPDDLRKNDIFVLGNMLIYYDKYLEIEELCREMLAKNIMRKEAYIILGMSSIAQKQYSVAEASFKRASELDSRDVRAFDGLALVCHETGRYDLSEKYLRKANELRPCYPTMLVTRNYKKIKNILDGRNIKLVCVQYPMRSIEPLKAIFEGERNILFVDNELVFKRALKRGYYKDFFKDMFGGDFGHCTEKGNKLLAQNIADVILKDTFGK